MLSNIIPKLPECGKKILKSGKMPELVFLVFGVVGVIRVGC